MPRPRPERSVVITALVAVVGVVGVVVGATAATGRQAGLTAEPADAPEVEQVDDAAPAVAGGLFAVVPIPPEAARDPSLAERAGPLVAQGEALRVESVPLTVPTTVEIGGVDREATTVYRVTISAGPYVVRDLPAILAVDGIPIGVAAESVDLSSLVLFTHDDVVVTDGATIALAYGLPGHAPSDWSATIEVVR